MDSLKALEDLSNAFGPSGFEDEVVAAARKHAPAAAHIEEDSFRNLYMWRPQDIGADQPIVMLDAHSDEVGFMVQAIRPNGMLQFIPLGGWVNNTIPAHRVLVRTRSGKLQEGIIASKPPHYMSEQERQAPLDISQMCIDVGASSAEEVDKIFDIGVGAPVSPDTVFVQQENGIVMGKAFDCRAGCASALTTLNTLMDEKLQVRPVVALAAQEEVGTRGAQITSNRVKPDLCIAFEGCPADDNFAEPWAAQTVLKKGPMLRHIDAGMISNPRFMRFALDVAKQDQIPVQEAVRSGGKTNGAPIHLSNGSVPCIVIGIPVRYIHTHYGYAATEDLQNGVKLALSIIRQMTPEIIASF